MARILDPLIELPGGASRLPAMEGLRAYAAAVVFHVHFFGAWAHEVWGVDLAEQHLASIDDPGLALATYLFRSHYGVDLFFFLSGYLVFGLITRPGFRYVGYLRDRWVRLYPALFATTIGIAVAFHGIRHLASPNLLANLVLLNGVRGLGVDAINTPSWSLLFEFVFYASFPCLLWARRGGRIGPWHVIGAAALFAIAASPSPGYAMRGIAFFAGAWLASVDPARIRRLAQALPDALVIAIFLVATTGFAFAPRFEIFAWAFLVPCVLLGISVLHGSGFLSRFFGARPLRAFGNVSYSFYLVHAFAIGVVFHFVRGVLPRDGAAALAGCVASWVGSFALAAGLAVVLFATLERPYYGWKQRRRRAQGEGPAREPDAGAAVPIG